VSCIWSLRAVAGIGFGPEQGVGNGGRNVRHLQVLSWRLLLRVRLDPTVHLPILLLGTWVGVRCSELLGVKVISWKLWFRS
jgi:hypothetical protein